LTDACCPGRGKVADNPHRLSKPLDAPFDDVRATRRGDYRVLYIIDDRSRTVTVLAVAHRRDAYRPRVIWYALQGADT